MSPDPANAMKERLRTDLRLALTQRRVADARLLRALIAALDNAEAPLIEPARGADLHRFKDRSAEIERMTLLPEHVRAVLMQEIEDRETAAMEMDKLGRPKHADILRQEAALAKQYVN